MKTLLVLAHPRRASLCGQVADAFAAAATAKGHQIELADLIAEGFDPVLREEDEPDRGDPGHTYSPAVQQEMARIRRNEATVMVFPVWWWSVPAILKGWIDRVWNRGFAYGGATYPQQRVWMIGVAGTNAAAYAKRGYDSAMNTQLDTGLLGYCGVPEHRLELLYGSVEGGEHPQQILTEAQALGEAF